MLIVVGYDMLLVVNGYEVLECLVVYWFDLMIFDLGLFDMNGKEVIEWLC